MLQRIQTVFMFLAVVAGVLTFMFPFASFQSGSIDFFIYLMNLENIGSLSENVSETKFFGEWMIIPLSVLQILFLILIFINIMQFKKRSLQIRLNRLAIAINLFVIAGFIWSIVNLTQMFGDLISYGIATVFPVIGIVFIFLANHNIKKDEKLIRAANRLR